MKNTIDFYNRFRKTQKLRPLRKGETEILIMLSMTSSTQPRSPEMIKEFEEAAAFPLAIFRKRAELMGYEMELSEDAVLYLTAISGGVAGKMVMLMVYLGEYCRENGIKELGLDAISIDIWPSGVPDEDTYDAMWEYQKDGSANKLDQEKYWV